MLSDEKKSASWGKIQESLRGDAGRLRSPDDAAKREQARAKRAALLGDVLGELGRTWKLRAVPDINDQDRLVALVDEVKKAVRLDDKLA